MMSDGHGAASRRVAAALAAFVTFGAFWGVWAASIPRVRDRAGVSDDQLGVALLCIGAGALPAMLLAGRVLDRTGLRVSGLPVLALGFTGWFTVFVADGFATLAIGLFAMGVASGATDVAMNSVVGRVERELGRPIITRAHALLSGCVVAGSLGAAAIVDHAPLEVPFAAVAAIGVFAGAALIAWMGGPAPRDEDPSGAGGAAGPGGAGIGVGIVLLGVLGAFAFASEGSHQNWSALFARDVLGGSNADAALAPAVFGAVVALTRLAIGSLGARHDRVVLVAGSACATLGALVIAIAHGPVVFVAGLCLAAAGTSVLFPTIVGVVARGVSDARLGRATSLVSTISYLGFLLGPVYVGVIAHASSLRVAMIAVAALTVVLAAGCFALPRHDARTAPLP